jgi:glycosyltransferase involved in cell wall biosynthesis
VSEAAEPPAEPPSLGIVVPVFNEEAGIAGAIREIAAVADRYAGRVVVIAVDDGSFDASPEILTGLGKEIEPLDLQLRAQNGGYGAALRTGAERAAELDLAYLVFIDSDLTNPPEDILRMGELAAQGHDYIKASRLIPGGSMSEVPASRTAITKTGNLVARTLFGTDVRDVTNGFRAIRTSLFLSLPLRERGFAQIVEEFDLLARQGIDPVELPTRLGARGEEQRRSAFSYKPRTIASYLKYPARAFMRRLRPHKPDNR